MELTAYTISDADIKIQSAERRREWMDETPKRFAYRCLPLSMANMHGWELTVPESFEVVWDGSPEPDGVHVIPDSEEEKKEKFSMGATDVYGWFGSGIVTFYTRAIFETAEGYNLWVTGAPNFFKDGIQPLSALVETDWMPYTFTMNWKITRPNHRIRFKEGDPYCFFFPVPRGDIEEMDTQIRQLEEAPEMKCQHEKGKLQREFTSKVRSLKEAGDDQIENLHEIKPQGWYMKGEYPDGEKQFSDHQRKLDLDSFEPVDESDSSETRG
jgi:hypothetical protein